MNESKSDVIILLRTTDAKERELMILLGEAVVRFRAVAGVPADHFLGDDQKFDVTEDVAGHFEDKSGRTLIEAYKLPTGTVRIYAPDHGLILLYDGFRVEIQTPTSYNGKIRGLCGTYDGDVATDFTTPKNCILKNHFGFAATYALTDSSCLGPVKQFLDQTEIDSCYYKNNSSLKNDERTTNFQLHTSKEENLNPKMLKTKKNKNVFPSK